LLLLVLTLSDLLLLRQAYLLGIHILLNPLVCLLRIEADLLAQRGVILCRTPLTKVITSRAHVVAA